MKKLLSLVVLVCILLALGGCEKYTSSYQAIGLVRSNNSHSCEVSFLSLEGQLVYKLKKSESGEGDIGFSVSVEEGEVAVYYDIYDVKQELVRVTAGGSVTDRGGYIEGGHTVYIIIEAAEGTHGRVSVELD